MRAILARCLGIALVASVLLLTLCWLVQITYVEVSFSHGSSAPNLRQGLINPHDEHGATHYIGWTAHLLDVLTSYTMFIFIPFLIVGVVFAKAFQEGKDRHLPK